MEEQTGKRNDAKAEDEPSEIVIGCTTELDRKLENCSKMHNTGLLQIIALVTL